MTWTWPRVALVTLAVAALAVSALVEGDARAALLALGSGLSGLALPQIGARK